MKFSVVAIVFQVILIILFATLVEYDPKQSGASTSPSQGSSINILYPMFQDVHVMIFVGFGFLMTFLKRYGYGAVGYNFFISALAIQWYIIIQGCIEHRGQSGFDIKLNMKSLITADFSAAAVLITFGAVLGKVSRLQLLIIAFIEIIMFTVNEFILLEELKVADAGGSMVIHCFGAYFGLALSFVLKRPADTDNNAKEGSVYHSDIFAMIGTVFLWMYWPSFNSALVSPAVDQQRAVINTYLSLVACCVTTFAVSALINKDRKLDMVHVQNATLAGGVAVGTLANMIIEPWGAILIGFLAAILSVVGYKYITIFGHAKGREGLHTTHRETKYALPTQRKIPIAGNAIGRNRYACQSNLICWCVSIRQRNDFRPNRENPRKPCFSRKPDSRSKQVKAAGLHDTGADVDLISIKDFKKIHEANPEIKKQIKKPKQKIYALNERTLMNL
ncbi:ammonium transporter Rh type A-like isoform X2, partial [Paramuricea clavata]